MCVIVHAYLCLRYVDTSNCSVEVEDPREELLIETKVNCLECQFLYRPNPVEDNFVCLRNLKRITNELDETIMCEGFYELKVYWSPNYIEQNGNYV